VGFLPQEHLTFSVDSAVDGTPWVVKSIGIELIAGILVEMKIGGETGDVLRFVKGKFHRHSFLLCVAEIGRSNRIGCNVMRQRTRPSLAGWEYSDSWQS
jgi:hypothetical protein